MPKKPDISFIIITYNDAERLAAALASTAIMSTKAKLDWETFVVDNGSTDDTTLLLSEYRQALGPRLHTLPLHRNLGTTVSRNLALRKARGKVICVLDSDAELLDDDLGRLLAFLDHFKDVGIVAPRILMPDGSTYNSVKKLPTITDKLRKITAILTNRRARNTDWYPDFPFARPRPVHTAISCCWFFRRELFDLVGPLDERIFYSPEDVDWCLRCWKAGKAVVYFPFFRVKHHTRQITHKRPLSRLSLSHIRGIVYYLRKHGYWVDRSRIVGRHIEPLACSLASQIRGWEGST